jgi:hypothetical protein
MARKRVQTTLVLPLALRTRLSTLRSIYPGFVIREALTEAIEMVVNRYDDAIKAKQAQQAEHQQCCKGAHPKTINEMLREILAAVNGK